MSFKRSASIASAQAAARSLASSGNAPIRLVSGLPSDCDIDFAAPLDHVVFLQLVTAIDHVAAVLQMKLPAVPRTDDVHVALVEVLAEEDALLADLLDHLWHLQAFAGRAALVRALIAVG